MEKKLVYSLFVPALCMVGSSIVLLLIINGYMVVSPLLLVVLSLVLSLGWVILVFVIIMLDILLSIPVVVQKAFAEVDKK